MLDAKSLVKENQEKRDTRNFIIIIILAFYTVTVLQVGMWHGRKLEAKDNNCIQEKL